MNAGFSSLTALKTAILPEALRQDTSYDAILTALGLGVVAQFEAQCNRSFLRTSGDTCIFTADRESYVLPRYPVESVTKIEMQATVTDGWVEQSITLVQQFNPASGLVRFGGTLGSDLDLVRLTYTGGFWWDTTEEGGASLPAVATALPADLLSAWHLQVGEIWNKRDRLGLGIAADPDTKTKLATLDLVPYVVETLRQHIRYQIT